MRDGFYFTFIKQKSGFYQGLSVSGGAGVDNFYI